MKETEYRILNLFKENPSKEISTSDIVKSVFPETESMFKDKNSKKKAKHKKAQLHRKILYYLNKLIKEEILELRREGTKGEKHFILALVEGEKFVIDKYKKRIIIEKPILPAMPVEGYEQQGFLFRFEPQTWVERLNLILLESSNFNDLSKYYETIVDSFSSVNDAVALNDFELVMQENSSSSMIGFFKKLNAECGDYGKKISCIIDLTNLQDNAKAKLIKVFELSKQISNINFVLDVRAKELREHPVFFEQAIAALAKNQSLLYVKNQDLHPAPYAVGRMGPYTFDPAEWQIYKEDLQEHSKGLACTQSCITLDVSKFLDYHKTAQEFRAMILAVAKALLIANSLQRSKSSEYFRNLTRLIPHLFTYSRSYIRFWNYGWKQPDVDHEKMKALIKSSQEEVHNFCSSQETIYLSCGMPTRFKIGFSSAFRMEKLSKPRFPILRISASENLHSKEIKDILVEKEQFFEIFKGGDRLRFVRVGAIDPQEITREISTLLTGYKLPFFCYDFSETHKDVKLSEFI